jgi:4-hydroxy-2-oxoheptanedioate aldolase
MAEGVVLTGTVLTLAGAATAELLAQPFDLVWIDLEHGALGPHEAQELILGAQAAGTFALVRLPARAYQLMTAMLDAGADGVVLADVSEPALAAEAASRLAHPPQGTRGWGPRRLSVRERQRGARSERPSLWAQVERSEAVEHAGALAAAGVDALVVGTADLSFSLGTPLDSHAPGLVAAVDTVRRASRDAGVGFGVAGALDAAPPAVCAGANMLIHSTDARLCAAAVDHAAEWLAGVAGDS